MTSNPSRRPVASDDSPRTGRRGLVLGAGVAGVAAIAAQSLHRSIVDAPVDTVVNTTSTQGEGYRLTPHVLRYYETTKA